MNYLPPPFVAQRDFQTTILRFKFASLFLCFLTTFSFGLFNQAFAQLPVNTGFYMDCTTEIVDEYLACGQCTNGVLMKSFKLINP